MDAIKALEYVVGALIVVFVVVPVALFLAFPGDVTFGPDHEPSGLGMLIVMALAMVVPGLILLLAFLVIIRPFFQRAASPGLGELEKRYAMGEISRDEFIRARSDILGRGAGA